MKYITVPIAVTDDLWERLERNAYTAYDSVYLAEAVRLWQEENNNNNGEEKSYE